MSENDTSYRQILKATSIFGGVQIFQIFVRIIRSKIVAVLLGPEGMGIMGLLNSTIGMITSLTSFGLGTSAVKDISAANSTNDQKRISTVVTVFRRLVWFTGLLGSLITLFLSAWLSKLTFGNQQFTTAFIWLSITLLITQLSSGQLVILQGFRKLKFLAKANLWGSIFGLIVTIPLYYYFRIDGIVPSLIGASLISLLVSWYFSSKVPIDTIMIELKNLLVEGRGMLQMGFLISFSGLMAMSSSFILRIFISHNGGVDQVGLYNAGFNIINVYVGLIFTAMATDYFPRLSEVAKDNKLCNLTINQQAEIALLILAPILLIFLVFIYWIIVILYSQKFITIAGMIHWAALGVFFKAVCWSVGFIFLAKGASKLFFWNELIVNIYMLGLNILGYKYLGLTGLGISFLITYGAYLMQVYLVSKKKYKFSFDKSVIIIFIIQFVLAIITFLIVKYLEKPFNYIAGTLCILLSGLYSIIELDKRINIRYSLKKLTKK